MKQTNEKLTRTAVKFIVADLNRAFQNLSDTITLTVHDSIKNERAYENARDKLAEAQFWINELYKIHPGKLE